MRPRAQSTFDRYNSVLRGKKSKNSKQFAKWFASCKGNLYTTTLHVINSVISKLSQLTVATTVWRGVYGGVLPREFWAANEFGVRGGVEWAFLSATQDHDVAFGYAASKNGAGIVFEFEQGMVDRGADLSWCSQYAHEREILFSPLTSLEVRATRVEGGTLVVVCRVSVNQTDEATDKVVSKRLKLLREMASGMQAEVSAAAASEQHFTRVSIERFNRLLREGPLSSAAERYNDDDVFYEAIGQIVQIKKEMVRAASVLPPSSTSVSLTASGWSLSKSAERVETLCLWLKAEPAAKELDISSAELPLRSADALGAALRGNGTLEHLTLARGASLPIQELTGRTPTRSVKLSRRKLGAVAGCVLAELIALNPSLESLDLSSNMLGQRNDAACFAIADALKAQPPKLSSLSLKGNYIGKEGAIAIADALTHNTILRMVDLSSNEIGVDAVEGLRKSLKHASTSLKTLRLKGNQIDDVSAKWLRSQLMTEVPTLSIDC